MTTALSRLHRAGYNPIYQTTYCLKFDSDKTHPNRTCGLRRALENAPASATSLKTSVDAARPILRQRGPGREIIETIILIGAIYALVNLATVRFIVEGPSMQPTFHTGQVLMISRVNYLFGTPQRGQVIVFNAPGQPADEPPYIKRVIGLPSETIEIRDTKVYVNGRELYEPYINEPCESSRCPNRTWQLGADEYFFMGDNRNHSSDSRAFGAVKLERVIGEALLRYWPPQEWGLVGTTRYPDNPFVQ